MRLLDRAILKEMAVAFILGLMVFTFVLLTNKILRLVELIVNKGVGIPTVFQLFLYILPYSLVVTIPMSVLLATLATFTRLGTDGEILALRGAGLSLSRLTRPAVGFGLVASALTLVITIWILPFSNHAFKNLVFQMTHQQATVGIQEGVFNSEFEGLILYVEHVDPKTSRLEGVFLVDNRNPAERRVIVAQSGQFTSDPQNLRMGLTLSQGSIHLSAAELMGRYRLLTFSEYQLSVDVGRSLADPMQRPLGEQELTLAELRLRAADLRAQGRNYHPPLVEFHKKLAIPISCVLFTLVGVPLGSRIRKGGRGLSLVISAATALGYYMLIVAGEGMGDRGLIPEALAMWLPNLLIALGGGLLLVRGECYPATLREALFAPAPSAPAPVPRS
ncbi:MAG: LPS export ABC transporter permease LptF [candidate division NC10 bacterium]|nr:LPS export ABC transporter permease LptF [candidate division NC10 bacterium]MBI3085432.1 LPS export ABC transporter permease LptF [candidate division NC10 bacterium]